MPQICEMSSHRLRSFVQPNGDIFPSQNSDFMSWLPPPFDRSSVSICDALKPMWYYEAHPCLPYVPANMEYTGALFDRLAHSFRSLPIEKTGRESFGLGKNLIPRWS